jgi:hypothetical protein
MAHASYVRNASMSLVTTVLAMSSSVVWSMVVITWCTRSSIAFACGFWHWLAYAWSQMILIGLQNEV